MTTNERRTVRYDNSSLETSAQAVIGKRFLPNGPFSAFFNDFEIFNGPFLIILHRLLWAIFQVNGTMAHGPLPSQSLLRRAKKQGAPKGKCVTNFSHTCQPSRIPREVPGFSLKFSKPPGLTQSTVGRLPSPVI